MKNRKVEVRMSEREENMLKSIAKKRGMTKSALIIELIFQEFGRDKEYENIYHAMIFGKINDLS